MKTVLKDVTLPDSGVTLKIRRIGPMQLMDIRRGLRRELEKPKPPMQKVLLGDKEVEQANEANPSYLEALRDWNAELGQRYIEALIRRAVVCEFDAAEVAELRAEGDDGLPADDKVLWVSRVAITSEADLKALQNAVLGRVQPTEAAVSEAADSFQR